MKNRQKSVFNNLTTTLRYWYLAKEFSLSWFKLRDQRSILGLFWSFLNPLAMSAILFFLFKSRMNMEDDPDYFLYILIGSVAWNYFATTIQGSLGVLVRKAYMMRNVVFPKEILVFSQVGVFVIHHILELSVVFLFITFHHAGFSHHLLVLPAVILIEGILILGITLFITCLCIYARDIDHIWAVLTRMGIFLVPIFYKVETLSPQFRWLVAYNPLTQIIEIYRDILLYQRWPDWNIFFATGGFAILVFWAGYRFFKFMEPRMVERA